MTPSKIFFAACLSFVAGIALGPFVQVSQLSLLGVFSFGAILCTFFWRYRISVYVGIFLIVAVMGVLRYETVDRRAIDNELVPYNDQEEKIVFVGTIVEDPDRRISSIRIVVKPDELAQAKILITMPEDLDFQYGDSLKISGFLSTPVVFDDFNYQEFLIKDGIYSVMYNPEIELLRIREGNVISRAYTFILSVKQGFRDARISRRALYSYPSASKYDFGCNTLGR